MSLTRLTLEESPGLDRRVRAEQSAGAGVDDAARDHDEHVIGDSMHLVKVVRHPRDPHAARGELARQLLERNRAAAGSTDEVTSSISTTSGAVTRRAGEAHALRLATRQRAGVTIEEGRAESDAGQRRGGRLIGELGLGDLQVVAHRAGERGRTLEHHPDPPAERQRIEPGNVVTPEPHHTPVRHFQAGCSTAAASTCPTPRVRRAR